MSTKITPSSCTITDSSAWSTLATTNVYNPYNYNTWLSNSQLYNTYTYTDTATESQQPLKNLKFVIDFDHNIENFDLLKDNIKGIRKNKFLFNCIYKGNRIQPYELIMKLIRNKQQFSVDVNVCDSSSKNILTIHYTNLQFIKIENNLNFNDSCDFSVLKVKFKCEKILHENHKLSEKEIRTDKLKKIIENNE